MAYWQRSFQLRLPTPREQVSRRQHELERLERTVRPGSHLTADAQLRLGRALRAAGDLNGALETFESALHLYSSERRGDSPMALSAARELGLTLLASSRLTEATRLLESVHERVTELNGAESVESAAVAQDLALAARARGDLAAARRLQKNALETLQGQLGEAAPATLGAEVNLADVFRASGEPIAAVKAYQNVLASQRRLLSARHPQTIAVETQLGALYMEQGDLDASRETLMGAMRRLQADAAAPGEEVFWVESVLARTLAASDDAEEWSEGVTMAKRVLEERREVLGESHPQTLQAMRTLALAAFEHDAAQGLAAGRRAAEATAETLGREHLDAIGAYDDLASILERGGQPEHAGDLRRENLELLASDEGIVGDAPPPIDNLSGTLTSPFLSNQGDLLQIAPLAASEPARGEIVTRTAHLEIDPAREIEPGERFEAAVFVDRAVPQGAGEAELSFEPPPGLEVLELKVWLVVSRHFQIEGDAVRALELRLAEESTPELRFAVRAAHGAGAFDEDPEIRAFFSYNGWPSGEVSLTVPLAEAAQEPAA